jgi:biopolymer transport protein TolQ
MFSVASGLLAEGTSFWSLVVTSVKASSPIENSLLLLLVACSIISWALVIWKLRSLSVSKVGSKAFLDLFDRAQYAEEVAGKIPSLPRSPHGLIFTSAVAALKKAKATAPATPVDPTSLPINANKSVEDRVAMEMDHTCREEFTRMHRGLDILASIASATPFIGLFGTVLGIMSTFQVLGSAKSASLNVVAPGIAAALIATAAGLAVAIPAVFLYNWLMARMDEQQEQAEMFIEKMQGWLVSAGAYRHDPASHPSHHDPVKGPASVRVG